MSRCTRCGRVWQELPDEPGDHPCECPIVADDWGYETDVADPPIDDTAEEA